jgi:hypothetical protein
LLMLSVNSKKAKKVHDYAKHTKLLKHTHKNF